VLGIETKARARRDALRVPVLRERVVRPGARADSDRRRHAARLAVAQTTGASAWSLPWSKRDLLLPARDADLDGEEGNRRRLTSLRHSG
jgi:hypothetical protein